MVAEYLDRDAVLDLIASCNLEDLQGWDYEDINPEQTEAVRAAILWAVEQMGTADTADVVGVVRCKDCKWYKTNYSWNGNEHKVCVIEPYEPARKYDDFCSRGERKDD